MQCAENCALAEESECSDVVDDFDVAVVVYSVVVGSRDVNVGGVGGDKMENILNFVKHLRLNF